MSYGSGTYGGVAYAGEADDELPSAPTLFLTVNARPTAVSVDERPIELSAGCRSTGLSVR